MVDKTLSANEVFGSNLSYLTDRGDEVEVTIGSIDGLDSRVLRALADAWGMAYWTLTVDYGGHCPTCGPEGDSYEITFKRG